MKLDTTARTLTLGRKDCRTCWTQEIPGTMPSKQPCPKCKGSGCGVRGGKGRCRPCSGRGYHWDHDIRETCPTCFGNPAEQAEEDFCDSIGTEVLDLLPFVINRVDRRGSWNEAYLGLGSILSVTDYGRAWEQDDETVLERAREALGSRVQAVKVLRPYERGDKVATLHDAIVVNIHRDGFTLVATSEEA